MTMRISGAGSSETSDSLRMSLSPTASAKVTETRETAVGEQGGKASVATIGSAISEKEVKKVTSPILSSIENLPFIWDDGEFGSAR